MTFALDQRLPKLPLLAAFLAGTVCGVASLWPARVAQNVAPAARPATIGSAVVASLPGPRLQLDGDVAGRDAGSFGRNLFAFLEPPRPRVLVVRQVATPIVTPAPVVIAQPVVVEPPAPAFPYRYIGTFGPRENVFAVFVRDGDVINIRTGEMIGDGFRLRRIVDDGVEVSWAEDGRTIRVPLTR